jgi:hypothetical protein
MNVNNSKKSGWKLIRDSFSKLIVWFKDGNVRTFYSIDWQHKHSKQRDENIGIARLRKKIVEWGNKADAAELYNTSTGERIAKFYEGVEVEPKNDKD